MPKNKKQELNGERSELLFLSVFFLLSLFCVIFSSLCLNQIQRPLFRDNLLWFALAAAVIIIAFFILSVGFILFKRRGCQKFSLSVYILFAVFLGLLYTLQVTGFFTVFNDTEKLQEYLQNSGGWVPIVYIILQFLQVIILPIPGIVSTAAGVAIFGPFFTSLYSALGIIAGSFVAFWIGRKWGNKTVGWIIGKDSLKKWQKKLKGKDNLFLTIMFILPLFPDDVLCFFAGLSTMSVLYFSIVIIITRLLGIFATCYSFNFIPFNTWWGIALWVAIIVTVFLAAFFAYKYMDKMQEWLGSYRKRIYNKNKNKK